MILARSYQSREEAFIVQGLLRNFNIDSYLNSNAVSSIFPAPNGGIARTDLYVDESNAKAVEEILMAHGD
jgi:hypothetical protein